PAPAVEPLSAGEPVLAQDPRWRLTRTWLLRAQAALVIGAALLSLLFYFCLPSTLPSEADYQQLAESLASQASRGDAVLLDPHWAERARLYVKGIPVLNFGRDPTREDLAAFHRLFVLSAPELPRSDREETFERLEAMKFRRAGEPTRFGKLSLALFESSAVETPSFDFTSEVAQARVFIRRADGSEELCPRSGERHPCKRAGWLNVGAEIKEIAFKPYRCLWAHPVGTEPLVVEYTGVPLGKELRVLAGIVGQIAFRTERYQPVTLAVKVDGELVTSLVVPPGEPGERRSTVGTERFAGGRHKVSFEVSTPDASMRHFCFDAGVYP
ncbi:MAG TPA: hypothetical protein DFS52_24200, partial [Myxococcales bacterium]|nr:hypothetical protein [Myxococcales bacterium]